MAGVTMLAAVCLLCAVAGLMYLAQKPFIVRVAGLEQFERAISRLVPLIGWQKLPLAEAWVRATAGQALLAGSAQWLQRRLARRDIDFATAFGEMVDQLWWVTQDDRLVLAEMGQVLGRSASAYQEEHLRRLADDVSRLLREARVTRQKDGRLYAALIGAIGAAVLILLL
jgi:stage III sporulation protein AB